MLDLWCIGKYKTAVLTCLIPVACQRLCTGQVLPATSIPEEHEHMAKIHRHESEMPARHRAHDRHFIQKHASRRRF